jgi:uncharacterized protein YcbK (DUF882 family)
MPAPNRQTHELLHMLTPHARRHAFQLLAEEPGLRVSSTRRTAARNRQVGGSPTSFHLRGRAVDFTADAYTLTRAAGLAWALRAGPRCTGPEEVLLEDLGKRNQHLHVAW